MKKIESVLFCLALICLLLLILLPLHVTPWADDYIFNERKGLYSITEYMLNGYKNWDGRYLSLHTLVHIILIRNTGHVFTVFVWSGFFLATSMGMYHLLHKGNPLQDLHIRERVIHFTVFVLLVWFGFSYHIADTVYWAAGGGYIMSLAMCMGWVWFYQNTRVKLVLLPIYFFITLITGLMGVIGAFPLLVFLIWYELSTLSKERRAHYFLFSLVCGVGMLTGIAINVMAPGNFVRGSILESSFSVSPLQWIANFFIISLRYLWYSIPAILAAVFGVWVSVVSGSMQGKSNINFYPIGVYLKLLMQAPGEALRSSATGWFLMAFSSVVPMVFIPDFAGGRTTIFFMAFLFMGVFQLLRDMLRINLPAYKQLFVLKVKPWLTKVLLLVFLTISIITLSMHHLLSRNIQKQVLSREAYLESVKDEKDTVFVSPIKVWHVPFSYKIHDNSDGAYARHYGFDAIIIKE